MRIEDSFRDRIFWITGASSGIGRALALELLAAGASVVLTARRSEPLVEVAATAPQRSVVLPADLENLEQIEALVEAAHGAFGRLDGLFYAAGVSQRSPGLSTENDVEERLFTINYRAPQRIIKALAPRLGPDGRLVVVGSLAAYVPTPLRSSYSAAKAAVGAYLESLSVELRRGGLVVTHVVPGFVRTEISRAALQGDGGAHGEMDTNQARGMLPEECARRILRAVAHRRPRHLVALGLKGRLALFLSRWFPGLLQRLLSERPKAYQ